MDGPEPASPASQCCRAAGLLQIRPSQARRWKSCRILTIAARKNHQQSGEPLQQLLPKRLRPPRLGITTSSTANTGHSRSTQPQRFFPIGRRGFCESRNGMVPKVNQFFPRMRIVSESGRTIRRAGHRKSQFLPRLIRWRERVRRARRTARAARRAPLHARRCRLV